MHTPNHLISPEVAILGGAVAATLIGVAIAKARRTPLADKLPLVGVMGAFVFAAQMLNFSFGDVGFSGHLIGAVLLAAMLGKWVGFLTLSGVLALQALLFADGGIMALGWNIINMAAIGSLVVYPLLFEPMTKHHHSAGRLFAAGFLSSMVAVVVGAVCLTLEASLSGTGLPMGEFWGFMLPSHLAIGVGEGLITGVVLALVAARQPALLECNKQRTKSLRTDYKRAIAVFALGALLMGAVSMAASELPDGLEWSLQRSMQGGKALAVEPIHHQADALQASLAVAPDYEGDYTGLLATAGILLVAWVGSNGSRRKKDEQQQK